MDPNLWSVVYRDDFIDSVDLVAPAAEPTPVAVEEASRLASKAGAAGGD